MKPPAETLSAWSPFWDAVGLIFVLQHTEIDDEHPEWRTKWIAGVVLLRTVGHVLSKIDAPRSSRHATEVERAWIRWKSERSENWIFWNFIEHERNNIVKAYRFGVELYEEGIFHRDIGEDGIQLFFEAVYWWRGELMAIEKALSAP